MFLTDRYHAQRTLCINNVASRHSFPQVSGTLERVTTWKGEGALLHGVAPVAIILSIVSDEADEWMTDRRPNGLLNVFPTLPKGNGLVVWAKEWNKVLVVDATGEHELNDKANSYSWATLGLSVWLNMPQNK